jgi:probable HAF family extracellular repeat protein
MRRVMLLLGGLAMLVASVAVASSAGRTPAEERSGITDLGTLGGRESYAAAINEKGRVVGWAETKKGKTHPFLWRAGRMTDLGTMGEPSAWATGINGRGQIIGRVVTVGGDEDFGVESAPRGFAWERGSMTVLWGDHDYFADEAAYSEVRAINDHGQMVGWADDEDDSEPHAFLWQASGSGRRTDYLTGLDLSKRRVGEAYDINERGQVVGLSGRSYSDALHATLWENGQPTDLGTLGPSWKSSSARAINDDGQVVGRSQVVGSRWHAFIWENGEMRDLGTLPGWAHSSAIGLNERGQVIGWSSKARGRDEELPPKPRAFLWQEGEMRDLGTLGGKYSIAYAINEAGQVVGQSQTANGLWHAFVWQNGKMTALPTLGGKYSAALAVNDAGQIVGWSRTRKDVKHAVLWTLKRGT